ncbi:hypothetical protein QEN19_002118 [Hanseniaspora menglaensis]
MVNLDFTKSFLTSSLAVDLEPKQRAETTISGASLISSLGISSTVSTVKPTATQSNGCVSCPDVSCPDCGDNYYCVMTSLTCSKCPITYCLKKSSVSSSTKTNHKSSKGAIAGGIVGGVVGGLLILAVIIIFFKKNKKRAQEERRLNGNDGHENIGADDDLDDDDVFEFDEDYSKSGTNIYKNTGSTLRSSQLEREDGLGSLSLSKNALGNRSRKNDETSSVSTANASNIIPIGYIPGIKTNGLKGLKTGNHKNIPDDLKSHYTLGSSILGDLNDNNDDEVVVKPSLKVLAEEEEETDSDFAVLVTPAKETHQTALRGKVSLVQIDDPSNGYSKVGQEADEGERNILNEDEQYEDMRDDDDDSILIDIDISHNK